MRKSVAPPNSMALAWLRQARGWSQKNLARAAGCSASMISLLEQGLRTVDHERLMEMAALMGQDEGDVDAALLSVAALVGPEVRRRLECEDPAPGRVVEVSSFGEEAGRARAATGGVAARRPRVAGGAAGAGAGEAGGGSREGRPEADWRLARQGTARLGLAMMALESPRMDAFLRRRRKAAERRQVVRRQAAERLQAEQRWEELKSFGSRERWLVIERLEEFQTWALAERLAAESARVAAKGAGVAIELAQMAGRVAELADVDESFRSRLLGCTRFFAANGLRAESRLREAEVELDAAKRLWHSGEDPEGRLPEWRLWDLEASLRRDQGRFAEALELLERARAAAPPEAVGRILLNMGFAREQAGDIAGALVALREAEPLVEAAGTARDRWVLGFNLTVNLCHLGHFGEAKERLPALRQLAEGLRNKLDLLKVQWLSGRVAAGLGRREEARRTLEQVRARYEAGGNALASAMVCLELAVLHLEDGRSREVAEQAEAMARIFGAEGVEPEALMAVRLFHEAARRETATVEEAKQLMAVVERAVGRKVRGMA
jgi:transcriptional regulator with XRE-family HTH domain/tetratricopeptide (TPR) repeat protein